MIKVTVLYPNDAGSQFDCDYYCAKHIPLVELLLGSALKGVAVERGVCGQVPGSPPSFHAIGQLLFESIEAFQSAFAPHAQAIMGDIPNYTDTQPIIQISEVKL